MVKKKRRRRRKANAVNFLNEETFLEILVHIVTFSTLCVHLEFI